MSWEQKILEIRSAVVCNNQPVDSVVVPVLVAEIIKLGFDMGALNKRRCYSGPSISGRVEDKAEFTSIVMKDAVVEPIGVSVDRLVDL